MQRTSFLLPRIHGTWVADGTHQTPSSHHWPLSVCLTVASRFLYRCKRHRCRLSVARRWRLVSRRHLLKTARHQVKITGLHTAVRTCCLIRWQGYEITDCPLYRTDFAPSALFDFGPVTRHLAGKWFSAEENVKQAATSCLQAIYTDFFLWWDASLGPTEGQMLKRQRWHVEVWCVPPAAHVLCIYRNRIQFCASESYFSLISVHNLKKTPARTHPLST